MLELLRQHNLALRQIMLFPQQHLSSRKGGLQFGRQRIVLLLTAAIALESDRHSSQPISEASRTFALEPIFIVRHTFKALDFLTSRLRSIASNVSWSSCGQRQPARDNRQILSHQSICAYSVLIARQNLLEVPPCRAPRRAVMLRLRKAEGGKRGLGEANPKSHAQLVRGVGLPQKSMGLHEQSRHVASDALSSCVENGQLRTKLSCRDREVNAPFGAFVQCQVGKEHIDSPIGLQKRKRLF